jgi:recombination associated protein RdgC
MWFKNLTLFRFTEAFPFSANELEEKLEQIRFRPCGQNEEFSFGWTAPLGRSSEQLIHTSNQFIMVCAQKEEKVLPAAVIKIIKQQNIYVK